MRILDTYHTDEDWNFVQIAQFGIPHWYKIEECDEWEGKDLRLRIMEDHYMRIIMEED